MLAFTKISMQVLTRTFQDFGVFKQAVNFFFKRIYSTVMSFFIGQAINPLRTKFATG
jgi:hypothetical protein